MKNICKEYPQFRFMLYYKVMTTLQQIGNNDLFAKNIIKKLILVYQ